MTGAPVKALAAAGAGMLLMGTAGTLIAVRRRRSYSAK
ncbi:LPXTG cell wall anchor domain-containing protein [Nonomuraea sp. NPDC050680]